MVQFSYYYYQSEDLPDSQSRILDVGRENTDSSTDFVHESSHRMGNTEGRF